MSAILSGVTEVKSAARILRNEKGQALADCPRCVPGHPEANCHLCDGTGTHASDHPTLEEEKARHPEAFEPSPRQRALAKVLDGFDDLAAATLAEGRPDRYRSLRRIAEVAARVQPAVAEDGVGLSGFDGDLAGGAFAPMPRAIALGGFGPPPAQDVYREIIGLAKPYLDLMLKQAEARAAAASRHADADPMEWTYEVERLSRVKNCFAPGSAELAAVEIRIRDLALRSVRPPGSAPEATAPTPLGIGKFFTTTKEAAPCPI